MTDGHAEPVYLCRCGQEHVGPYAAHDYFHHMCFHDAPLVDMLDGHLACGDCGKTFHVDREPMLSRWGQIVEYLKALYR